MEFVVKTGSPEKQRTACLVVGVYEAGKLTEAASAIDQASEGYIANIVKKGDHNGKVGHTLVLHHVPNVNAERVMLVGCGKEKELTDQQYRKIISKMISALNETGANDVACYLPEIRIKNRETAWKVGRAAQVSMEAIYRFDGLKSQKDETPRALRKATWMVPGRADVEPAEEAVREARAVGLGVNLARDLGNMPGNICTPAYLAEQGKSLANEYKAVKTKILEESDMEKLGMGAFLCVSKGSSEPAKLIIMEYRAGKKDDKPIVLIGKGLTFDSGGISIKPAPAMDEMKYDMCGGASIIGTIKAIAELGLPLNVIGLVPSSENMPDGAANKPGDIVTSLSGQTIEILNTDAEGRLILCDTLTYAERYEPDVVIDVATLTGACVVALGKYASGLFSNHGPLTRDIEHAADTSGDRVWEMPLWDDYQEQLKSNFADMANVGGREAGAVTAACFLARFTKKFHWAHLDVAGSAWNSGSDKGSTGRPVPLLTQYLIDRAKKHASN